MRHQCPHVIKAAQALPPPMLEYKFRVNKDRTYKTKRRGGEPGDEAKRNRCHDLSLSLSLSLSSLSLPVYLVVTQSTWLYKIHHLRYFRHHLQ